MSALTPNTRDNIIIIEESGAGGDSNPPITLEGESQENWDASKPSNLVRVTEAEFNAAMAAQGTTAYGMMDPWFDNNVSTRVNQNPATIPGLIESRGLRNQTAVPAGNYIRGLKVRVMANTPLDALAGMFTLFTADDTGAYPFGNRKVYAELGHDFLTKTGTPANVQYEYFLIKGESDITTTRVGTYLWSAGNWPMAFQQINVAEIRMFPTLTSKVDAGNGTLPLFRVYATPTKSW